MFQKIVGWAAVVILGLFFALVGFSKLAGPSGANWAVRLSHWGYPAASRYVIGGVEIVAGLALVVPAIRGKAAVALMVVMAGALLTHLIHGEYARVGSPLVLGGLLWAASFWNQGDPTSATSSDG